MNRATPFDGLIEQLSERVAEKVAAMLGHVAVAVYTTAKRGPHIPGKSRTWMMKNVRKMQGAKKIGRDWMISADDYQRWATARDASRFAVKKKGAPTTGPEALAEAFLSGAGLRPARRADS